MLGPLENPVTLHYTYVLKSQRDHQWYSGCTNDLRKRLTQHTAGAVYATKARPPFELIYYEACRDARDAYAREKFLKSGPGKRYLKNRLRWFLAAV